MDQYTNHILQGYHTHLLDGTTTVTGIDAQSKFEGKLTFTVPDNTPASLWYGDGDQIPLVEITVIDPLVSGIGNFSRITTTGNLTAQGENAVITLAPSGSSGTVVINPANGGTLSNMDITANLLTVNSTSNFTGLNADVNVSPAGNGRLTVAPSGGGNIDGVNIGLTKAASVTTNNLTATSGTINNTTIGAVTPANATFATAQVQAKPNIGYDSY